MLFPVGFERAGHRIARRIQTAVRHVRDGHERFLTHTAELPAAFNLPTEERRGIAFPVLADVLLIDLLVLFLLRRFFLMIASTSP